MPCRLFSVIFFKSPHIYWTKHSLLMDSINLMTSKPRRENMFMRSIISIEHRCKTATLLEDERTSLFICGDVLFLFFLSSQRTARGLSSQDANDVLPSAGISHQSVYEPPFPVIIPWGRQWWTEGGERAIRPLNLYPTACHLVLTSWLLLKVRLLINHAAARDLMVVLSIHQLTDWCYYDLSLWEELLKTVNTY